MSLAVAAPTVAKTLVVEDDEDFIVSIEILLGQDESLQHRTARATSLSEARAALATEDWDVVLLDMQLPDSAGADTLREVIDAAGDVPVVVLTSTAEWDFRPRAITMGAEDYVVKHALEARVLNAAVRHAVERRWLRNQLVATNERRRAERELAGLGEYVDGVPTPTSASLLGDRPLQDRNPQRTSQLRAVLREAIEHALDTRAAGREPDQADRLRGLAAVLGQLHAGPRDVVRLHADVLADILTKSPSGEAGLIVSESRLVLLELMGQLVNQYRSRSLRSGTGGGV